MIYIIWILLLAYPIMGMIQVLRALYYRFDASQSKEGYVRRLNRYLAGVAIYFIVIYLRHLSDISIDNGIALIYLFIIPWGLAFYFWSIFPIKNKQSDFSEHLENDGINHPQSQGYFN